MSDPGILPGCAAYPKTGKVFGPDQAWCDRSRGAWCQGRRQACGVQDPGAGQTKTVVMIEEAAPVSPKAWSALSKPESPKPTPGKAPVVLTKTETRTSGPVLRTRSAIGPDTPKKRGGLFNEF